MPPTRRSQGNAAPAAPVEQPANAEGAPRRPVHSVRIRNVRGAIWANESSNSVWYNVTFSRAYRDDTDGQWKSSESFSRDDLLLLAKVADQCHTWITDRLQEKDSPF